MTSARGGSRNFRRGGGGGGSRILERGGRNLTFQYRFLSFSYKFLTNIPPKGGGGEGAARPAPPLNPRLSADRHKTPAREGKSGKLSGGALARSCCCEGCQRLSIDAGGFGIYFAIYPKDNFSSLASFE